MESRNLKINFGCGGNRLDGWMNHDIELDVTKLPLPYENGVASVCFSEHMPEHLSCSQCLLFIEECRRILMPGGVLRLCLPVVGVHLNRDHCKDLIVGHGHMQAFDQNIAITMLWAAGFQLQNIKITGRKSCDGHHKVIGKEKDDIETLRIEACKEFEK